MTTEKIATNLEGISAEAVTFELEDWKPSKETPLQNQAYCAVQRMSINLKSCRKVEDNGCSRINPTDIITVRKSSDVKITNKIGDFFRGLNFIAYEFTNDTLSINTLSGLVGYIYLFEGEFLEREVDGGAENVTISLVVDEMPESLIEKIKEKGKVEERGDGIFRFNYDMDFQIIIPDKLPAKEKGWLEGLMKH